MNLSLVAGMSPEVATQINAPLGRRAWGWQLVSAICPAEAKANHAIFTSHEGMDNGERRFRLLHADGTGYIRTEATAESGWQNSHVHAMALETYVVQSGWMALAELIDRRMVVRIVHAGEIVTTRPGITHNVYLSDGAIIHTVKHGTAIGPDREAGIDGPAFDLRTKALDTEDKIRATSILTPAQTSYPEEYRHFDNLIWQVPAWATAIFALSIQSILQVVSAPNARGGHPGWLPVLVLFLAGSVGCFAFVLARFRTHQRPLTRFKYTPPWMSASTWTQCLVTLEAAALFGVALVLAGTEALWAVGYSLSLAISAIIVTELGVRRRVRNSSRS
jgi:hypothetical protein